MQDEQSTDSSSHEDSTEVREYLGGKVLCTRCQQLEEPLACEHCIKCFCKTCLMNSLLIYHQQQQPKSFCGTSFQHFPEPEDIHKFMCQNVGCSAIIPLTLIGKHEEQCLYKIPPQENQ